MTQACALQTTSIASVCDTNSDYSDQKPQLRLSQLCRLNCVGSEQEWEERLEISITKARPTGSQTVLDWMGNEYKRDHSRIITMIVMHSDFNDSIAVAYFKRASVHWAADLKMSFHCERSVMFSLVSCCHNKPRDDVTGPCKGDISLTNTHCVCTGRGPEVLTSYILSFTSHTQLNH